jgi:hypothetical protein
LPNHSFDNVSIEVDVTLAAGAENSALGLICRAEADASNLKRGYKFLINPQGAYGAIRQNGTNASDYTLLGSGDKTAALHSGNATNHLRADCVGNNFTMYVNGQKLLSAQDSGYRDGQVGLSVNTQPNGNSADVRFDNFVVREAAP